MATGFMRPLSRSRNTVKPSFLPCTSATTRSTYCMRLPPRYLPKGNSQAYSSTTSSSPKPPAVFVAPSDLPDPFTTFTTKPLKPVPYNCLHSYPSTSSPLKSYHVTRPLRADGTLTCDCKSWRSKKAPHTVRSCKHIIQTVGVEFERERLAKAAEKEGVPVPEVEEVKVKGARKKRGPTMGGDTETTSRTTRSKKPPKLLADGTPFIALASLPSPPALLLANKYNRSKNKPDPTGYWLSEKLDGVRAFWDGEGGLWSRLGNPFYAPAWWKAGLPTGVQLDGEAWSGRGRFNETVGIVKGHTSSEWGKVRFQVFDVPSETQTPFEERMEVLKKFFPNAGEKKVLDDRGEAGEAVEGNVVDVVEQVLCKGQEHLLETLTKVQDLGGEGLMLREPGSLYIGHRSSTLLKVKTFHDAEARIISHASGTGKYASKIGALVCCTPEGVEFRLGSGLSDLQREWGRVGMEGLEVGKWVTYRYGELGKEGVPRFPSFVGPVTDKEPQMVGEGKGAREPEAMEVQ